MRATRPAHTSGRDPEPDGRTAAAHEPDGAGGPDGRRERVTAVAERLFAERGYRNVSVRDIAREAGVTHPLIYYYWGSKKELLAATVARSQSRIRSVRVTDRDRLEPIAALARESLEHNRAYMLTLIRALLDGMPPSEWPGGFPAIEASVRMVTDVVPGGRVTDARARVAAAVAMTCGWVLVEDALLEIVGLTPGDRDHAREVLLAAIRDVVAQSLAGK